MVTPTRYALSALAIAALLSGCGGGGGSGSNQNTTSGPPASGPAPAPAPSPTPTSNTYPSAPANANGPVAFDVVGWRKDHGTGTISEIAPADFTFRWDGQSYYDVAIASVGAGRLRYFFGRNSNPNVFSLEQADGTVIPVALSWAASEPLLARPASAYWHYPASGTSNPPTQASGAIVLGRLTSASSLPASGTRTYRYEIEGSGTAEFTVNFGDGTIGGGFAVSYSDAWGPYPPTATTLSDLALSPDRRSFTAKYSIAGLPGQGTLKGWFFGPAAESIGLIWRGPMGNPYDSRVDEIFGTWRLDQPG